MWFSQNIEGSIQPIDLYNHLIFLKPFFVVILQHCSIELDDFEVNGCEVFLLVETDGENVAVLADFQFLLLELFFGVVVGVEVDLGVELAEIDVLLHGDYGYGINVHLFTYELYNKRNLFSLSSTFL